MNKYISLINKIHIHPLLWFMCGIAIVTAHFKQFIILFFIVFIHELGHAIAALFFSWRIKQILLLPFGGVAETEEYGNRPLKEEIIVLLAGPAQHVWLVLVALLMTKLGILNDELFELFLEYNTAIFLINFLPIWPLDGGKLLFVVLTIYSPFGKAYEKMLLLSFSGAAIFVLLIFWIAPYQISLWMIAIFLFYSLVNEWKHRKYVVMRFLLERYYGRKVSYDRLKPLVVEHNESITDVLSKFYRGQKHSIVIMKNKNQQGSLDENELLYAYFAERRLEEKVGNLLYSY